MATTWHLRYQQHYHPSRVVVVLSVLFAVLAQQATAKDYFPNNMKASLDYLNTYLKYNQVMPSGGRLFFAGHLNKADAQEPAEMILASETLKVYGKILSAVQSDITDKTARDHVQNLKVKIEELRKTYFRDNQNLLDHLKNLQNINASDKLVQHKAIFELKRIYNHASAIGEASANKKPCPPACSLRRRRQTRQLRKAKPQ